MQDSIISTCEEKVAICTAQLGLKDQVIQRQVAEVKALAKKNKRLTITRKVLSFSLAIMTATAFIGFVTH